METLFVALRVLLSLGAVLVLLWLLQRRFARGGAGVAARKRQAQSPSVLGRQSVGAKASVVVIEHDGQRFLLGVTENSVNVLHSSAVAQPDDAFARELAAVDAEVDAAVHVAADAANDAVGPAERPLESPLLAGSILAPETWKQAAAVVRNRR